MRIVNIEDFFHPYAGYQVNVLAKNFARMGHEVYVVTAELEKMPDGLTKFFGKDNVAEADREYEQKYNVKIIRIPVKHYISGRVIYDKSIYKTVKALEPDVLYVHGNDTYIGMKYLSRAKKLPFAVITDSHMLSMASTNKLSKLFHLYYKWFVTPKIKKNGITVIRTQDDDFVQRCLGIPLEQAPWVSFGSDVMLFHPDEEVKRKFREENGISADDFVVVYAGKLDEAKGAELLAKAFEKKLDTQRNVVLVAVGTTEGEYGKNVEEIFQRSQNRVLRFPTQKYVDLARFYQCADIAVFARQCSLSFYDVQACGLPVVSEDNNINVDRCSHENGMCFTAGDAEDFRKKIEAFANMDSDTFDRYKDNSEQFILSDYNYSKICEEYMGLIEAAVERRQKKQK